MDNKQLIIQVIKFNKTVFDNAFKAMVMAQEQGEKIITTTLDQASWMPEEGKKAVLNWVKAYQKGSETFKSAVDEQYKKVEDYFANT